MTTLTRCRWVTDDPLYLAYHDEEWGMPVRDDRLLFEMLILEGAQAGLSWLTVLKKRAHYRKVYDEFDVDKIAQYDQAKVDALLQDAGIIRNRLKVRASIQNAQAVIQLREEGMSLGEFLWQFVDNKPIQNQWKSLHDIPAKTVESDAMSKALKKRGFKFVGSTICYAFMQGVGMVNDHTLDCHCYKAVKNY